MNVFTYWEGELPFVNRICLKSISEIYKDSHVHITPNNLHKYLILPDFLKNHKSIAWRADYIRGALLYEYGGLWLDSDIVLNRKLCFDGSLNTPRIWKEGGLPIEDTSIYKNFPELCIGTMYSPKKHSWLHEIFRQFREQTDNFVKGKCVQRWASGQRLYRDVIYQQGLLEICSEKNFNLICDATRWHQYWDGTVRYSSKPFGIHLLLGAHNNGYQYPKAVIHEYPQRIENLRCEDDLFAEFPNSVLAEYLQYIRTRKGSP